MIPKNVLRHEDSGLGLYLHEGSTDATKSLGNPLKETIVPIADKTAQILSIPNTLGRRFEDSGEKLLHL